MEEREKPSLKARLKQGLIALAVMGVLCAGIVASRASKPQENIQTLKFQSGLLYPTDGTRVEFDKVSPCKIAETIITYDQDTKVVTVAVAGMKPISYQTSGPLPEAPYQLQGFNKDGEPALFSNIKTLDGVEVVVISLETHLIILSSTTECQTIEDLP